MGDAVARSAMIRRDHPVRFILAILPFISVFFFPWLVTLLTGIAAGLVFPPLALLAGVLSDVLYHSGGWFWGTTVGLIVTAFSYFVRQFVSRRII